MLEAKLTVYTGHLTLGRMIAAGKCDGVVQFDSGAGGRGKGEWEGSGEWRFIIPKPTDCEVPQNGVS